MHFLKIVGGYKISENVRNTIKTNPTQMLMTAKVEWSLLKNSTSQYKIRDSSFGTEVVMG